MRAGECPFLKVDGDWADDDLGAGNGVYGQRLRRRRTNNDGRKLERVFWLGQDQLALPSQRLPQRQVVAFSPYRLATSFTVMPGRKLSDTIRALTSSGYGDAPHACSIAL
jgi:hypothetical protein